MKRLGPGLGMLERESRACVVALLWGNWERVTGVAETGQWPVESELTINIHANAVASKIVDAVVVCDLPTVCHHL